jgi:putative ABC transport system permease protein
VAQAKAAIENYLLGIYKTEDAYRVSSMAELLNQFTTMLNVIIIILTTIAAISLFVGGIGIMNIMLISVSERTKEIGIRKSLGAKQRHIMRQFVIEAATTSALGGVAGIGLGYLLSAVGTRIISTMTGEDIAVTPSASSILMAFLISAAIGVLFGYLPAKKAARLNPIDALRYE